MMVVHTAIWSMTSVGRSRRAFMEVFREQMDQRQRRDQAICARRARIFWILSPSVAALKGLTI